MGLFKKQKRPAFEGGGLVIFMDVPDAIGAEKALKRDGYAVRLVAPPPALRKGCDLAVEINLVEQVGIERLLVERDVPYVEISPLRLGTAELLDIVKVTDFGCFVEVLPGQDGLVHISQLENRRVENVRDVVQEGDEFLVRCLDIDRNGRVRLSRKAALDVKPEDVLD